MATVLSRAVASLPTMSRLATSAFVFADCLIFLCLWMRARFTANFV
eukprot:CAMPEP_0198318574 /NCGR_PEP_ID=MMETSP1450-20131203/7875_1 /TAXON_ID=753684 ORGANISM="Madagascaria erythrocladiodes, Strain CCMP3234" /NCGR_SAMPLE_ID=MMETSP1450 /ASSEMBLY_ACC=CAM_ASM_001115 /LENGTH=45 /DNA_ID= /DNA_START= /DNA_END= /DNA_ORIENTATION=